MSAREQFSEIDVYLSCNFLQHLEGETCVDNDENKPFYLGLPFSGQAKTYGCSDLVGDKCSFTLTKDDNMEAECAKLRFLCQTNSASPMVYLIACIIVLAVSVILACGLYWYHKRKLQATLRVVHAQPSAADRRE